jgi:hypothetical protein
MAAMREMAMQEQQYLMEMQLAAFAAKKAKTTHSSPKRPRADEGGSWRQNGEGGQGGTTA